MTHPWTCRLLLATLFLVVAASSVPAADDLDYQTRRYVAGGGDAYAAGFCDGTPLYDEVQGVGGACFVVSPGHAYVEMQIYNNFPVFSRQAAAGVVSFETSKGIPVGQEHFFCDSSGAVPVPAGAPFMRVRVHEALLPVEKQLGSCNGSQPGVEGLIWVRFL